MSAVLISLSNQALSLISKGSISSLQENTPEADDCALHLPQIIDELAERSEWPMQIKRVALAQITNDRPAEWLYAYRAPADMADPLHIRRVEDDATRLPEFTPATLPVQNAYPLRFIVEGDTVYTNVEAATLVYTNSEIDEEDLRPLQKRAIIDSLAALLALSLKRDQKLANALMQKAEASMGIAISDAHNRNPRLEERYVSEAELARRGLL